MNGTTRGLLDSRTSATKPTLPKFTILLFELGLRDNCDIIYYNIISVIPRFKKIDNPIKKLIWLLMNGV